MNFAGKFTVSAKLVCGFGLVLACMAAGALVMSLSIGTVREQAAHIRTQSIPLATEAARMKLATVDIQQALTDVSATKDEDGFKDAEKSAALFGKGLNRFRDIYSRQGNGRMMAELDAIEADFKAMYGVGKRMAEAYLKEGQEAGNVLMKDFDARTEALAKRMDPLQEGQLQAADGEMDSVLDGLHQGLNKQYLLLALSLCLGTGCAVLVSRSILRQLGAEPATVGHIAGLVAEGNIQEALDLKTGTEHGVMRDMLDMAGKLQTSFAEVEAKKVEAEVHMAEAVRARQEAEQARRQAERAKAEGMLDAAGRLEGVVAIVTSASEELSAQIEQSSQGAGQQAARVGETATAMDEMNATVLEVAKNAALAANAAEAARMTAQDGAAIVGQVVKGIGEVQAQALGLKQDMASLGQQAEAIGRIMQVIEDIADQTNLLALNAAIEAARAGDAGRGFAVVADEVRKLAEKTMTATKEVGQSIGSIQEGTRRNIDNVERSVRSIAEATDLATKSGKALQDIVSLVDHTSAQVMSIATASEEQSSTSDEINRSIEEVNTISSETAQAMDQAARSVSELASQSLALRGLIEAMQAQGRAAT